ncbi:MAG: hypothetical protein MI863_13010 [Desulfobacterales bacterium]|nr:hypothetical protein [Desulfobacterales bacterium]
MKLFKSLFSRTAGKPEPAPPQPDRWSIGIYTGDSVFNLRDPGDINPVLTADDINDEKARLVADPFMINHEGTWYMFFEAEVESDDGPIGKIGLAVSGDGFNWAYRGMVLEEPFHLSYPYVFSFEKEIYMIPETRSDRTIRLYKATDFPFKWSFEKTLLRKRRFADNSLFRFNGLWWMFTDSGNHTLRLYYSDSPLGKWKEHRKSPILKRQASFARPGGRVVMVDNRPVRFAQDAFPVYGSQVWGFKITTLTPDTYEEVPVTEPIIKATGSGWNARGMHTVDPHILDGGSLLACVDGLEEKKER